MQADRDRDLYVIVAVTRWDGPAYTERHIAEALSRHGDVLWVEPPLSVVGARRRDDLSDGRTRPGMINAAPGIVRLFPPTPPGKDRPGIRRLTRVLHSAAIRSAVRRIGRRPRAVLGFSARLDPFPGATDPTTVKVAWVKDDILASAELTGLDPDVLAEGRRRLLREADLVVAASPKLVDDLAADGVGALLLPAAVDTEFFAVDDGADVPSDVRTAHGAAAGFIGQLGDRVDVRLLEAVVDADVPLLLVGRMARGADEARFRDLLAHPSVTWTGPKPYGALPGYLNAMGVGTVPYALTDFNRASFPLKILEYLGAGLDVVSSDLPAARWLDSEHVRVASGPSEFSAAVAEALDARSASRSSAAREVASLHSWAARADVLLAHMLRVWSPADIPDPLD